MKYISLIIGKILVKLLSLLGRNAGSFPGQIAIKFCKDILKHFDYPKVTVLITGTNGKTSTSNLISKSFEKAGFKTISNSRGDNIIYGISTLLIKNASLNFKINAEIAVIEVDELTLAKYLPQIKATDIVITNFFRDQLDRAGEMESIILKIEKVLREYKGTLYLNEDDPNVKRFFYTCTNAQAKTYSMKRLDYSSEENSEAKEGKFCPLCNSEIIYEYYQYSHIGKFACKNCEFKTSKPDYLLCNLDKNDQSFEVVKMNKHKLRRLHYNIDATYHLYNLLASSAVLLNNKVDVKFIDDVFSNFNLGIGRMEKVKVHGKIILLNLVKNPTGCNEIIKYIEHNREQKALIFLLNDNDQDGRDTSWIWDVQFENIHNLGTVILTGKRAYEAGIRFKLSEIAEHIIIEKDVNKAIDLLLDMDGDKYIISTYTGLFSTRELLMRK